MTKQRPAVPLSELSSPSPEELKLIDEARLKISHRRRPVTATVVKTDAGTVSLANPHCDGPGWSARMQLATGSASPGFADRIVADAVTGLQPKAGGEQQAVDIALAVLDGSQPENEIEAMLVAQMLATYTAANTMLARAIRADRIDHMAEYGNLATKLQRTFAAQIDALKRLRAPSEQRIVVQHVHVSEGGQAIVGGNVVAGGGGAASGSGNRPLVKGRNAPVAALSGADPAGLALPGARDAKRALLSPRRSINRRATWKPKRAQDGALDHGGD